MTTPIAASPDERQAALDRSMARQALQWLLPLQLRDGRCPQLVDLCRAVDGEAFSIRFAGTQELVRRALDAAERGRLLVVRDLALGGRPARVPAGSANGDAGDAVSLARELMDDRPELPFEGGRYRIATTPADFRSAITQNFRPVSRSLTVLTIKRMGDKLADTPAERESWSKLLALISESGGTDRITLLRYAPPASLPPPRTESAITPAQLKQAIAPEHWFEVLVEYDDGTPYDQSCVLMLPNGVRSEGPPDENGTIRVDGLPAAGTCVLSFPVPDV